MPVVSKISESPLLGVPLPPPPCSIQFKGLLEGDVAAAGTAGPNPRVSGLAVEIQTVGLGAGLIVVDEDDAREGHQSGRLAHEIRARAGEIAGDELAGGQVEDLVGVAPEITGGHEIQQGAGGDRDVALTLIWSELAPLALMTKAELAPKTRLPPTEMTLPLPLPKAGPGCR